MNWSLFFVVVYKLIFLRISYKILYDKKQTVILNVGVWDVIRGFFI